MFWRRGCTIEGFGDELCNNETMSVPKRAGQVGDEPQEPGCFPNPLCECGARSSPGKVKVPSQVSVFVDDVEWGLSLVREGDGSKTVAPLLVGCKSPRLVGPDFSAECIEVFKGGVH